jgi:hypothetical protein
LLREFVVAKNQVAFLFLFFDVATPLSRNDGVCFVEKETQLFGWKETRFCFGAMSWFDFVF